ncbi:MAG: acetate kinase [Hespellia sp.]|nr:acetate kinase [Hespellia sp.]
MNVLIINCGSSSLKFQLIDSKTESVLAKGLCERIGIDGQFTYAPANGIKETSQKPMPTHDEAIQYVLASLTDKKNGVIESLEEIDAVGHRVVHGGEYFSKATLITDEVMEAIDKCSDLAPLHNPANLIGIRACQKAMPNVPMSAVFDTAFHQTMPPKAYLYAIPYKYYEKYKIRKYGFHGTSHSYVSQRLAEYMQRPADKTKTIVCHLGNGASVTAIENGRSVATSMGFTPLAGLAMGTRCGSIDVAIVEYLANKENLDLEGVLDILNKESGVLGLSDGLSSDFRDLFEASKAGNKKAEQAIEAFCYNVARYVGQYVAVMNGVDSIVFTAGIGENVPGVRSRVCAYLEYLGINLNITENRRRGEECLISTPDSKVKVWVIPTNEELAIARETVALL